MREWLKEHERFGYLIFLLALVSIAIIGFGRVEFHNEIEREVYVDEFLGYADEEFHSGTIIVKAEDMPEWCRKLGVSGEETVEFADGISGQVGIFADVIYYENHYEVRTWFSGKTLDEASEFYYRINSPIQLRPVYQPMECIIDVENIRGGEYDYTAFKGKTDKPE
ncbi:MAG: hypothetical protein IKZ26_06695 [Peptococcaceae bacterium]|nr:hypothetical protein [Peptococcaceae bacterium]